MILERAAGSLPARGAVLILLLTSLSGCAAAYYGHAVSGQLEILNRRQPIEEILADGNTDPALSTKLQTVLEVRRFAFDELGLPDNGSDASYADVGRPFVVWNVVAADEFAVDPDSWCFLFVGCVSYRGYFSEAKARAFAASYNPEVKSKPSCTASSTFSTATALKESNHRQYRT